MLSRTILSCLLLAASVFGQPTSPATPPTAIALYSSAGAAGNGPKMLEEVLSDGKEFKITRITAEEIRAGKLKNFTVLIVPGGSSSSQGNTLGEDGREMIRKFIDNGGTYVGICAGCYLASCNYKWSLNVLPVKVVDSNNWERGKSELKVELTPIGKEWTTRKEDTVKTLYHNGPVLEPIKDHQLKLIPLAIYREEITKKGAKTGLMIDTPAIAATQYGKGWAVGISPHPEQTEGLKDIVPNVIRWTLTHPAGK